MSSSTSSSNARKFVVLLGAAIFACELTVAISLPGNRGRNEVDHAASVDLTERADGKAVVLSDSVTYGVLLGRNDASGIIDLATIQWIGLPGNAFLLSRYLERAIRAPKVVVYVASPISLSEGLNSPWTKQYFSSVFTRDSEIAFVQEQLGRPDLLEDMQAAQLETRFSIPSHMRAGHVSRYLGEGLRIAKGKLGGSRTGQWGEEARAKLARRKQLTECVLSNETQVGLRELARVTAAAGSRLALAPPPLPPELLEGWQETGYWADYCSKLEAFADLHSHVSFRDEPLYLPTENSLFVDGIHFGAAGKDQWGAALVTWIGELISE